MSEIKLYLDEDAMRGGLIGALRAHGFAVTTPFPDRIGWPDDQQLRFAAKNGLVLYTFNDGDFRRLHQAWLSHERHHAGIIIGPQQRYSIGEQLRRLQRICAAFSAEQMEDRVEYLSTWAPSEQ